MKDLGVKIEHGRYLSTKDLTLNKMKSEGFEAVFIGIGNPEPKTIPIFDGLDESKGYYTSKGFLPQVARASKAGKCSLFLWLNLISPPSNSPCLYRYVRL